MITSNRYYSAIAALLLLWAGAAAARPSPERIAALQRGINITHWFRFPPSVSPAALTNYLSTATSSACPVRLHLSPHTCRASDRARRARCADPRHPPHPASGPRRRHHTRPPNLAPRRQRGGQQRPDRILAEHRAAPRVPAPRSHLPGDPQRTRLPQRPRTMEHAPTPCPCRNPRRPPERHNHPHRQRLEQRQSPTQPAAPRRSERRVHVPLLRPG